MFSKNNFFTLLLTFGLLIVPFTLNAQDDKKEQNQANEPQTETMEQTTQNNFEQFDQKLAAMNEEPDDITERQFEAIAEKQTNLISQKVNLDEDKRDDIKEAITEYLGERWEKEVLIAKNRNDSEEVKEQSTELAYLRVDLAEEIKDELSDAEVSQWDNNAVDFRTSLNWDVFHLKTQKTGIATSTDIQTNF